jgi:tRNA pseudouridine55 synthase
MTQPLGILNIDKPAGLSSRRVVDHVVRRVRPARAGHAGTLDPLATGVLVVCVGRATRLIAFIQELPKSYRARFILGRSSATDDITGDLVEIPGSDRIERQQIEALLPQFTGRIQQVPPQFSAVHVAGERAYRLARRGREVKLAARSVEIDRLSLVTFEPPEFELDIECGSGTYVRSIGRDLGLRLGCGAVMSRLVRTRVGPCRLEDAASLDDVDSRPLAELLLPARTAVGHLASCRASPDDLALIGTGRSFRPPAEASFADAAAVAVFAHDGELACIAIFDAERQVLAPSHVFIDQASCVSHRTTPTPGARPS